MPWFAFSSPLADSDVYYAKPVSPELGQSGTNFLAVAAAAMFGLFMRPRTRSKVPYIRAF